MIDFQTRRISPKQLAALGWSPAPGYRCYQHRDGWLLQHCGHPTANFPYLLISPCGRWVLTGALSGDPARGHAWHCVAWAAQFVASLSDDERKRYEQ